MNEHQIRLWKEMIILIESYLNDESDNFYETVGKLEGALDASELSDKSLVNQWYDFWTPLEIQRAIATEGIIIDKIQAIENFQSMREFLIDVLNHQDKYS